ncbi:MAG: glycine cleavage system protein H [Bryobacteraceae bacterium]
MIETVPYKRSRFSTRLPARYRYTRSHYWLFEVEPGIWQVGLTRFATRMLGDLVEYGFPPHPGERIEIGQVIGWVEGFKALSDLFSVVSGEFVNANPELERDITLLDHEPYGRGWLYRAKGTPEADHMDAQAYMAVLDATIDKLLSSRYEGGKLDE